MALASRVRGEGQRALVFLHGLLFDQTSWSPLIEHLDPRTYRCVTFDFPGHGDSPPPAEGDAGYDMDNLVRTLTPVIEEQGRVDLVGFSLGGFVALRIAIARPELVRSLILISTSADAELPKDVQRYGHLLLIASVPLFGTRIGNWLLLPKLLDREFRRANPAGKAAVVKRLNSNPLSVVKPATAAVLNRRSVRDDLAGLTMPTLCIAGECDDVRPISDLQPIVEAVPSAQLAVVPGARHLVPYTHAKQVAGIIHPFLQSVPQTK